MPDWGLETRLQITAAQGLCNFLKDITRRSQERSDMTVLVSETRIEASPHQKATIQHA